MNNQRGITLVSLVIYIIMLIMVIGVMASMSAEFSNNTEALEKDTEYISEFTNFNQYFIKEIKQVNNKVEKIDDTGKYILFKTGNFFSFNNSSIFFNNIEISTNVRDVSFKYITDNDGNIVEDIIEVYIQYDGYAKQMKYKVEGIY